MKRCLLNIKAYVLVLIIAMLASGCGPIKPQVEHTYTLTLAHAKHHQKKTEPYTLLISKPSAMSGLHTGQMLYLKRKFMLEPFAKNAWESPPADMLYPLLVKRFQGSHAFQAIASSPYADKTDYRLDTQLIDLYQDFTAPKSTIKFTAKVAIARVSDNHVLGSKLISRTIPCSQNTPYGGVMAANVAVSSFIEEALHFVIKQIEHDKGSSKT